MTNNDKTWITTSNAEDIMKMAYEQLGIKNPSDPIDLYSYISKVTMDTTLIKPTEKAEEWIWVTGYKGTDRDMKCKNDYQFEIGKKFNMPKDADIRTCNSGFHFCTKPKDVFGHYAIGNGHRFFEVSALVRKSDYNAIDDISAGTGWFSMKNDSKIAAKSIIFTRELTVDEVLQFAELDISDWTEEEKRKAMAESIRATEHDRNMRKLVDLGYTQAFALWIIKRNKFDDAYAVGQQKDLSMDMKVACILS